MAQIQNPFNGGAALATMANMAKFNPLANAGERLGQISQLNQRDALGELMAANGGNVNQAMAPTALLATPEAQLMFGAQQDLQRTDRGLDQQDTQLGISQQNANTSSGNLGLSQRKFNDKLSQREQGLQELAGFLQHDPNVVPNQTGQGAFQPSIQSLTGLPQTQTGQTMNANPYQIPEQPSEMLMNQLVGERNSMLENQYKFQQEKQKQGIEGLAGKALAFEKSRAMEAKNIKNPSDRQKFQNDTLSILTNNFGAKPTMDYSGEVTSAEIQEETRKANQQNALSSLSTIDPNGNTIRTTSPRNERAVNSAVKNDVDFSETDLKAIDRGSYVYDTVPREEKKVMTDAVKSVIEDKNYDYSGWSGLPWNNDDKKKELLVRSLGDVVDPDELPQLQSGNMETVKEYFERAGIILLDENTFGSNFELTTPMKQSIEAREVLDTMEAEVRAEPNKAKRVQMKARMESDPDYQEALRVSRENGYTDKNMDLAKSIK